MGPVHPVGWISTLRLLQDQGLSAYCPVETHPSWWDKPIDEYLKSLARKEAEKSRMGHREAPSAQSIIPEYQNLKEGHAILDGPPGAAFFTVRIVQPNRALFLYSDSHVRYLVPRSIRENPRFDIYGEFSWTFILEQKRRSQHQTYLTDADHAHHSG